jgi:hypothetical protein
MGIGTEPFFVGRAVSDPASQARTNRETYQVHIIPFWFAAPYSGNLKPRDTQSRAERHRSSHPVTLRRPTITVMDRRTRVEVDDVG